MGTEGLHLSVNYRKIIGKNNNNNYGHFLVIDGENDLNNIFNSFMVFFCFDLVQ